MISLFYKDITGFFSSITGYIVIVVFLTVNSLFLWIFPGGMNILDSGYASLEPLFTISPMVFMFLIPAVTMKSFAEEKKSGNMELLLTRPLSDIQIVLAKYLSGFMLTVVALLPTLIYLISVRSLGSPEGNVDMGGTWGSYIGLLLLASAYVAIGVFASSLTDNVVVAFVLAVLLSFFLYMGFGSLGHLSDVGSVGNLIIGLGMESHYNSLRRGVIDSRDVIYFLSLALLFIYMTKLKLKSRNW